MLVACDAELTSGNYLGARVTLHKSKEIALILFSWPLLGIFLTLWKGIYSCLQNVGAGWQRIFSFLVSS